MLNHDVLKRRHRRLSLDCNDSPHESGTDVSYRNSSGNSPSFATLLYLTCDFLFLLKFLDANDANDAAFAAQIRKETI